MWKEILSTYGGRIAGVAAGVFFGCIYLIAGFWDMLFFALLTFIGYYVGRLKDERTGPVFPWERLTGWLNERWRWFK
ncbi:hypothetical protein DNH61_22700 [Paenibacillus sambharensis]|uniref:DUF2273 domain-containing protein n=1 Tax=Paenibacillus sambharensis TaxID=1803190 RepID=A0A2W1L0J6_9BACL|nr:DUF2273 domain-containing protein [Paenibacillus sambharensis]PZD93438.1 hypothetical protein DNH61_22700 [Paenibacillus sambharensis]